MPAFLSHAKEVPHGAGQGGAEARAELRASLDAILRFGRHDDFDRIAFEASESVDVEALKSGGELVITFDRAVEAALPSESAFSHRSDELPQMVFDVRAEDRGRRYRIGIDPDTHYRLRHWSEGRLVVIDIVRKTQVAAATEEAVEPSLPEDSELEAAETDIIAEHTEEEHQADGAYDEDETEDIFETIGDFEVVLGGSLETSVATASGDRLSDDEDDRGYAFFTDAEIDIDAYATILDDVDIGASITLDANADESVNADSAYLYTSNGFGTIEIGRTSGAEDDMALGADTIATGTGGIDGDTANLGDTQVENSGDAAKISYFTPRISGFQAGVSYTPDTGDEESDNDDGFDLENHVGLGVKLRRELW